MHALLNLRLIVSRQTRERLEWRDGCLDALAARLFPELPAKVDEGQVAHRSPHYQQGFRVGMTCPAAVSLPDLSQEFDHDKQHNHAALVSFIGLMLVIAGAYFNSHQ